MLVQEELRQQLLVRPRRTRASHCSPLTDLQRWGLENDTLSESADAEEPLVLALLLQQRALHAVRALFLQLPSNSLMTDPPLPISLSGDPEPLPHLPPPPPTPRVYSLNASDLQVICDVVRVHDSL